MRTNILSKKAQIKMAETIAVLFVFFILLAIGMIFFSNVQKTSTNQELELLSSKRAVEIALRANYLPELGCRFDNVVRDNCIDLLKAKHFTEAAKQNVDYYYDVFGFAKLTLQPIYPDGADILIYSHEKKGSHFLTRMPMVFYDPVDDRYNLGVLNVETFY